jgi:hypothetical protein
MIMQPTLATCVLLAAGFDWLEALLPFLFVAFWIVSQVFAVFRRLQGGGQKPPPLPRFDPARDRPRPPQPAAEGAGDLRSELEKQIAEFLRVEIDEKKPEPNNRKREPVVAPRPQPSRPDRRGQVERRRPQPPVVAPARRQREQKKVVEVRESGARPTETTPQQQQPPGESVASHVESAFARDLTHLRGAIAQDDPQAGVAQQMASSAQAQELVQLLRNPATIRQAILLREVLDRPVDRW